MTLTPALEEWIHRLVFVPIVLASAVALAAFLAKWRGLRRQRTFPSRFLDEAGTLIDRRAYEEARTLCRTVDAPSARLVLTALTGAGLPRKELKERIEETGSRISRELDQGLDTLGVISTLGPLFGLFGTVVGMVLIFHRASVTEGLASPQQLAGGISTALYATIGGLIVGIGSIIGHRYLLARVDSLVTDLEELSVRMADRLAGDGK